ncbi:UNVERIFIED_CONTAM: hypothetical protein GTU68_033682 [Idotea baltica]|nr:hypothetical protein [Idotea baltica]
MANAHSARNWFLDYAKNEKHIANHFVGLSTNEKAAIEFGIGADNIFRFWDWVGGRYSWCSAIGLSIACAIGFDNFRKMLDGAHQMDEHFKNNSLDKNIPVILALIGVWQNNFLGQTAEAVIPYHQLLHRFAAYLQQANMESNGKQIDRNGKPVEYATGPLVWGEPGTNSQHAFFQLLHQGTQVVPIDFIAFAKSEHGKQNHQDILMANCIAQAEALAFGKNEIQLKTFKVFEGNRPSNMLLFKQLNPESLGQLIAIYEHKIFVQGIVWNIFSFDQWGVELGKQLAKIILPEIRNQSIMQPHDSSTKNILSKYMEWKD